MSNKIINGQVYINMSTLKNREFFPFSGWTNLYVNSDCDIYNERTLNGGNPRPIEYYSKNGKYSATVTRPKSMTLNTIDKRTQRTIYKHIIEEMLPNPFPTVTDLKTQKLKPKQKLDETHEHVKLALLFPDDEWAEDTYDGWTVTHRMNMYHEMEHVKWITNEYIEYRQYVKVHLREGIHNFVYRDEIEKRFKIYEETPKQEQESEAEQEETTDKICLASLYGLEGFTNWFYDKKQDVFYNGSERVPWSTSDGEPVIEITQDDKTEQLTYDDLIDLMDY